MKIVGVDPGVSPTLCFLTSDMKIRFCEDYSGTVNIAGKNRTRPTPSVICKDLDDFNPDIVVIEDVWAMPKQGVTSASVFVGSAWLVEGIAVGLGLSVIKVRPQAWKKFFKIPPRSDKDASRVQALKSYPHLADELRRKKDHNRADALFIALWAREASPAERLRA